MESLKLDDADRALLVNLCHSQGFPILQHLMEAEVKRFTLSMVNADPANPQEVIAAHHIAKAAAQFYQQLINRLNTEMDYLRYQPEPGEAQPDATQDLFS